jgi:hypothetical protein
MFKKVKIAFLCFGVLSFQTTRPIDETTATVGAFAGGSLVGIIAGLGTHLLQEKNVLSFDTLEISAATLLGVEIGIAIAYGTHCLVFNNKSFDNEMSIFVSALVGVVAGGAAGLGIYHFLLKKSLRSKNAKKITSILSGINIGIVGCFALSKWFHGFTPTGRFEFARKVLGDAQYHPLLSEETLGNIDIIYTKANLYYNQSWPLVDAKDKLRDMSKRIVKARTNLEKAYQEAFDNEKYTDIRSRYHAMSENIKDLENDINTQISCITNHRDYNFQKSHFESYKREQQRREDENRRHQERMNLASQLARKSNYTSTNISL